MHWHWLSTTVELAGTLLTGGGLLWAYKNSTLLPHRLRELWHRLRHGGRNITVHAAPMLSGAGMLSADAFIAFQLDENATPEEKFAQLEKYVRELRGMFGPVNSAIARLDKAIQAAREHADATAAQALLEAKAELERFDQELKPLRAVDLHWAAAGAFVMAVGYALSYFSCFRY